MIIWLIIILIALFLFLTMKIEKFGRGTKMFYSFFIILLLILFYFSVTSALAGKNIDYKSPKGIMNAAAIYGSWVVGTSKDIFSAGAKSVGAVGNVIRDNFGGK
jgi:FtsH-binding integral membrane protein